VHLVVIDAFTMMQIAIAVFIGNALTLLMVKGYQKLDADGSKWFARACYALPLAMAALALIGSKG
jgi:hypothetical protein